MNKRILLTGASGGIGRNCVKPLLDAGYDLVLHYHNNLELLVEHLDGIKVKKRIPCLKADLTKEDEVQELFACIHDTVGPVDILINNAGVSSSGMSWKLSIDEWNHTLNSNITTAFLASKHAIPMMRERQWGRIINIASVVAQIGMPGTSAYAASKSALYGFTRSVAKELANKNITVNTLSLGYMETGMIETVTEEFKNEIIDKIPMKKLGSIDSIVSSILFLISEESSYITGQDIGINGGLA